MIGCIIVAGGGKEKEDSFMYIFRRKNYYENGQFDTVVNKRIYKCLKDETIRIKAD